MKTISQTTNAPALRFLNRPATVAADTIIPIPIAKARKIVLDLEYLKVIRQQVDLLKDDTTRFSFIISQKDSAISIYKQKEILYGTAIFDQKSQIGILQDEKKLITKKNKWLTVERDGAVVLILILLGFAIHK